MEAISIEGTSKTPTVILEPDNGKIEISGMSIPEDSMVFYKPILEWIDGYSKSPAPGTEVIIKLDYFNTSSSKFFLDIFQKLERLFNTGFEVVVHWYYEVEDEDMLGTGEDYQSILKIPFKMISYEDD